MTSSSSRVNCRHWFVRHRICLVCKKKLQGVRPGSGFDYLFSGLHLNEEAISFTKRLTTLISIHGHKKLHLILDLDHTLIHSIRVSDLSEAEKCLMEAGSRRKLLRLGRYKEYLIKFRPFVNEFLEEANKLFNMYVYTKATPGYGRAIARMIDPKGIYFGDRVITRQESPNVKTLVIVLADERGVLIVDDTYDAWPNHKRNLLQIPRYFYFKNDYRNKESKSKSSYAERKRDESKSRGALANLLKFLMEIHNGFFSYGCEEELDSKDVRSLLKGPFIPKRL